MKHLYCKKKFDKEKYDRISKLEVLISQCNCGSMLLYLNKIMIKLEVIERIEFDKNNEYQLTLYIFYQKNNKDLYEIIEIKFEDYDEFEEEYKEMIGDIFCYTFINEETTYV